MLARWFAVAVAALVVPAPLAAQETDRGEENLAEVEPAAGDEEGGGFFEFLRNLEVTRPRLPDRGGDGGGGGGDSGGSGGHD